MQVIFTGPKREAHVLRRILRDDGIDATVMTAADPPSGAVFVPADDAESPAVRRALERRERDRDADIEDGDDDDDDDDRPRRAPDALYWHAFSAMRTAHARIEPFEEAESVFDPDDVEWASSIGLDEIYAVMRAVEAAQGTCRIALEEGIEKAAALLMGMRAIALVMRNPLADNRREITAEDPDKQYNATTAIGYLLRLLDELASDGAAEQWMREDARGPDWARRDEAREADEADAPAARSSFAARS